jgi:hypothetical protein
MLFAEASRFERGKETFNCNVVLTDTKRAHVANNSMAFEPSLEIFACELRALIAMMQKCEGTPKAKDRHNNASLTSYAVILS